MIGFGKKRSLKKETAPASAPPRKATSLFIMALEPRIMFDAAAVATVDHVLDMNHDDSTAQPPAKTVNDMTIKEAFI